MNADATDEIVLGTGTFTLSFGELVLPSGLGIVGTSPRETTIRSGGSSRVIHVPVGATDVLLTRLAVDDGFVNSANGGDILNEGELSLFSVAVTGGCARPARRRDRELRRRPADRAEPDRGQHRGLLRRRHRQRRAQRGPGKVEIADSTITGNSGSTGSAIQTGQRGQHRPVQPRDVRQQRAWHGLTIATSGQTVEVSGSIFYNNTTTYLHCGSVKPTDLGYNVESADNCTFRGTGSKPSVDPLLSGGLTNAGGPTDLFTIASGSPAENAVAQCGSVLDQRGYLRDPSVFAACDAGAYEIGGQPFTGEPSPTPTATPTAEPTVVAPPVQPAVPAAKATATPVATPVAGKSVGAAVERGKVLVKLPGTNTFVPLAQTVIPNGTEVDTRNGAADITRPDGGRATFDGGLFKVGESGGYTVVTLTEQLDCKTAKRSLAAKKPKTRKLWGDGKGKFRTEGKYSAATVRGTRWLVQDTCTTTTTRVTNGVVEVRDRAHKKVIVLRKGKSYVARARK